jgi:hypothetical protein
MSSPWQRKKLGEKKKGAKHCQAEHSRHDLPQYPSHSLHFGQKGWFIPLIESCKRGQKGDQEKAQKKPKKSPKKGNLSSSAPPLHRNTSCGAWWAKANL